MLPSPRAVRAAAVLAVLLLAGCASSPQATQDVATQPTITGDPVPAANAVPEAEPLPAPRTALCDVVRNNLGTPVGLGLYADRIVGDTGCVLADLFGDLAGAGSLLVEVTWTPGPGVLGADAWFESDACIATPLAPCQLPRATKSAGPLSLVLEGDTFLAHRDAALEVQVAGQGAAVQQAFQVHATLFANATVDAGFTALA